MQKVALLLLAVTLAASNAFVAQVPKKSNAFSLSVALSPPEIIMRDEDHTLSKDEANPILRIGKDEKIVNQFGLWCAAVSILTGPIWAAAMAIVDATVKEDPTRSLFDRTGKVWAKVWLTMTSSFPMITGDVAGIENRSGMPCLYVSNHASWLDIPVLCTVLGPVFKFIAKGELRKVPCIGQQLHGGNHILIDRDDRRSQLKTFKDGIKWLRKGVPIMAFPEGKRSPDGRLMEFKRGLFSLAIKAGVPIVPITLANTYAVMPSFSFFPIQEGAGKIHVHVGQAIDTTGKTEAELEELVRLEFMAHLPESQQPRQEEAAVPIVEKVLAQTH